MLGLCLARIGRLQEFSSHAVLFFDDFYKGVGVPVGAAHCTVSDLHIKSLLAKEWHFLLLSALVISMLPDYGTLDPSRDVFLRSVSLWKFVCVYLPRRNNWTLSESTAYYRFETSR